MTREAEAILAWIEANCPREPGVGPRATDSPLLEEGGLDSVQILRLVNFLEGEFAIAVDLEELVPENFENVDRVVALVHWIREGRHDRA